MGLRDVWDTISSSVNRAKDKPEESQEGASSNLLPELSVKMPDTELLELSSVWLREWEKYEPTIRKMQEECENYWKGKQYSANDDGRPLVDNIIFESLETFLPRATKSNPEPVVSSDNTPEGEQYSKDMTTMLAYLADRSNLRLKIKKMTRFWALYFLGAMKVVYEDDEPDVKVLRPQRLILDPTACIDEAGFYTGNYVGEYREKEAKDLADEFESSKQYISDMVQGKMKTKIKYIEWWTNEMVFWELKGKILGKAKNPHWNYPEMTTETDEFGMSYEVEKEGINHLAKPTMPYIFLSVFNIGKQPHDDTSLIWQNLSAQDRINKRLRQLDKNIDNKNGALVVSGDSFEKAQAEEAGRAMRRGGVIYAPRGKASDAASVIVGGDVPQEAYQDLVDTRQSLRGVFGTTGLTAQGMQQTETVRGKIIVGAKDDDRITGGITEYLEQAADQTFNWFVQMMYVYYDTEHYAAVLGDEKAQQVAVLSSQNMDRILQVSVKEGSLAPRDLLTKRNEAVDLWGAGALDLVTLLDRLDFPNPRETAKNVVLWQTNPRELLGMDQPAPQPQAQAQAQAQPAPEQVPQDMEAQMMSQLQSEVPIQ